MEGIKVLSFTHFLQGPSAVQILADLGAEVIKVEPIDGSYERTWSGYNSYVGDVSVFFALANRNQKSLAINFKSPQGNDIVKRLILKADVLVQNFRPGVLNRVGFGYDEIHRLNPKLIYCSLSGYGTDGPYKDKPGQDLLVQAMSGLASLTGPLDVPPTPVGSAVVDQHAATLGALGIMAALVERQRTGVGKLVESNLLNSALDLQIEPLNYFLNTGSLWERSRTGISTTFHQAPYGVFATNDSWIAISLTPIEKLKVALKDERLWEYSKLDQFNRREELNKLISDVIKQKSYQEWAGTFETEGIWYAPVNDYSQVVTDKQVEWNKMIVSIDHPDAGKLRLLNHPIRYNGEAPTLNHTYPPRLGEHTREILLDLGISEEDIRKLIQERIVAVRSSSE